eukprot:SAG31_NODE_101_length_25195_cov_67.436758_16_plen_110_part_00
MAPVGDYEAVRDARQRAEEEAKIAREQEAVAARERRRRIRMAIGQAAEDEIATNALVNVRDRTEWDRSLVLGIVSHNLVVKLIMMIPRGVTKFNAVYIRLSIVVPYTIA